MIRDDSLESEVACGKRTILSKKDRMERLNRDESKQEILKVWEHLYNEHRNKSNADSE